MRRDVLGLIGRLVLVYKFNYKYYLFINYKWVICGYVKLIMMWGNLM